MATLCPVCGEHVSPYVGFDAGILYDCKKCGYHGPVAIDSKSKEDAEKIRKKLSKYKSNRPNSDV